MGLYCIFCYAVVLCILANGVHGSDKQSLRTYGAPGPGTHTSLRLVPFFPFSFLRPFVLSPVATGLENLFPPHVCMYSKIKLFLCMYILSTYLLPNCREYEDLLCQSRSVIVRLWALQSASLLPPSFFFE